MHEFELGVWKSLFIHLIRILEAEDRGNKRLSTVGELDRRFASSPDHNPFSDPDFLGTVWFQASVSILFADFLRMRLNTKASRLVTGKIFFRSGPLSFSM